MSFLDRNSPTRVTLRAGVVGSVSDGATEIDDGGIIYLILSGSNVSIERRTWPDLEGSTTPDFLLRGNGSRFAIQPARPRDFFWLFNPLNGLIRYDIENDGSIGSADATNSIALATIPEDARPTNANPFPFTIDGDVFYYPHGIPVDAEGSPTDISGVTLTLRALRMPTMERIPELDIDGIEISQEALDFNAKSGGIVSVDVKTTIEGRVVVWTDQYTLNVNGNRVTAGGSQGGGSRGGGSLKAFINTASSPPRVITWYRGSGFSVYGLDAMQIGASVTNRISLNTNRDIVFAQNSRDISTLSGGGSPVLPQEQGGVVVTPLGLSAGRITEANDSGGFRERRQLTVEMEMEGVSREFLLNREWYFEHEGRVFQMDALQSEQGATIASFSV